MDPDQMGTVAEAIAKLQLMNQETPVAMGISRGRFFMIAVPLTPENFKALNKYASKKSKKIDGEFTHVSRGREDKK